MTTTTTRAAGHARSASKPTPARRIAIRASIGTTCILCGKQGSWARADVRLPHALQMAHVVGENIGGTYKPGNIGAAHDACNDAQYAAGVDDVTADVIPGTVPTAWLPTKVAQARADVRDCAPMVDAPTPASMAAARRARGLSY